MEDNEPFDPFYEPPSPTFSDSDSDEEEEVPLNQQIPRIAEANSATDRDWSRSSQDIDGNGMSEPSASGWRVHPSTSDDDHPDSEGDDHPMETVRGEDPSNISPSETSDEEVPRSNQPFDSVLGMNPSETVAGLCSRADAFVEELLRSLSLSRLDYPSPPGRLPVSFSPESSSQSIQMKINLKSRTSSIVRRDIPPKFRNENDRNRGLPTMDVSAESIRGWFDHARRHLAFWVTRLVAVLNDETVGDEDFGMEVFGLAFELFQTEFLDFDEMVTFALKWLRPLVGPDVIEELDERHRDVRNMYWKLEIACFTGRMKDQQGYLLHVSEGIESVLIAICSIYATD